MFDNVSMSWGAIVLAGVINMFLGWLWYSPMLFGKMWMEEMKIKEMKPNPAHLFGMFVIALGIAFLATYFVSWAGAMTFTDGLYVGVLAGITFFALPMASGTMASNTTWRLWAINSGYWVVALALMGGVLASMHY